MRPLLLASVGLIAVVILAVIAWSVFKGTSGYAGGSSSAHGAVEKLAGSIQSKDVAAAISVMNPDEMREAKSVLLDVRSHAVDVGIAPGGSADAFTVDITGLDLKEDQLADDVVKVELKAGSISATADTGKLPAPLKATFAPGDPKVATSDTINLRTSTLVDSNGDESAPFVIVVKRHGSWFISPMATAAELYSQRLGLPSGRFGTVQNTSSGNTAKAATPTDAVEGLARAAQDMDVTGVGDYMVKSERWLVDAYAPAIRDLIKNGSDVTVDPQSLGEQDLANGRKAVRLDQVRLGGTWTDDYGDSSSGEITISDDCITGTDGNTQCLPRDFTAQTGINGAYLVTVKEDGQWRVSIVETALSYLRTVNNTVGVETIAGINPAWAATLIDPQTNIAAGGGTADVTLNEVGTGVLSVDATAGGALTMQVDDSKDGSAQVAGVFDAQYREWQHDSGYVPSPTAQKLTVVITGDPGTKVSVTVAPVTLTDAVPGPVRSSDTYQLATFKLQKDDILEVTPSDPLLYGWIPDDPSSGWGDYGDGASTCTSSNCHQYGSSIRLLLPPNTSVTTEKISAGFDNTSSTTIQGAVSSGAGVTHTFFVTAYDSVGLLLQPSGFDGVLDVNCGGHTYSKDSGLTDGAELLTISEYQDTSCQVTVSVWGSGGGSFNLQLR
jgi:hypothetical protein